MSALDAWHEAEAWTKNSNGRVDLAFPGRSGTYEAMKNAHLDESYRKANELLESEQFDEALHEFDAILDLDGTYEDAPALRVVAYEPRYRAVLKRKRQGGFVKHTRSLARSSMNASYKDASGVVKRLWRKGATIALVEFQSGSSLVNLEVKVQSMVEQRLMDTDDPFLKVVDREVGPHSAGQNMGMNGLTSGGDVELGNILGAKALLKATITTANHSVGPLTSASKSATNNTKSSG